MIFLNRVDDPSILVLTICFKKVDLTTDTYRIYAKNPMAKKLSNILHTSDIHLDDCIGGRGKESPAQLGFIGVIDAAIALKTDIFLLAGDLFEHNRVQQACLNFASTQLARLSCPVVMIAGNHDCLAEYSIYHSYDPTESGSDIHFIRDELGATINFNELGIRIWGKSIIDHEPENKPLDRVPQLDDDRWNVGMVHGYYVNRGGNSFSSLITPEEIEASCLDYLALGHVHVFSEFDHGVTRAAYSGSPSANQGSKENTAAHITLDPDTGVTIKRILV
ncbi:MAG: DNA repair exonuclease [Pseudomonadales bacterium]|nr:DNA repair exonuclease [Pseudomonadales bacterium]